MGSATSPGAFGGRSAYGSCLKQCVKECVKNNEENIHYFSEITML